ncbi:hypothetical protein [Deinococcus sp. Leaf326]|uniref:hypothetical protein n=1 Tax=Deinococcus sp. Leaf326 TaxID=1736338 RepID=UPI0006FE9DEF|nr:hypothetical protein [Deinococcus sp. Leaf326]KQR28021.1 hypothetical protein ASF71_05455 [Deinococcus sp. Leaf326]
MQLLRKAHEIEYRDSQGVDRAAEVDIWASTGGGRVVLVLRNLHAPVWPAPSGTQAQARAAVRALSHSALPYLIRPDAELLVLVLHPREEGEKARALVLPLSA